MNSSSNEALRKNEAFTLIEVLLAAAIMSACLMFIFRAINTALFGARTSQNMYLAGLIAENRLWELKELQAAQSAPIVSGRETKTVEYQEFALLYTTLLTVDQLVETHITVSWKDTPRSPQREIELISYLSPKKI